MQFMIGPTFCLFKLKITGLLNLVDLLTGQHNIGSVHSLNIFQS